MHQHITDAVYRSLPCFLHSLPDPYDINCGECEDFAMHVINQLGGETDTLYMAWIEDLVDTPYPDASHAVICFAGEDGIVYFDAECPGGTADLRKIPAMANAGRTREEVVGRRRLA